MTRGQGSGHRVRVPATTFVEEPRTPHPKIREAKASRGATPPIPCPLSPVPRSPTPGRLFVVATPIGNLGDLSPRAKETLADVDLILAEDTRRVRKLLSHFLISTPTRALHEHNEEREVASLLAMLTKGRELALVSDAGTPLLSDPGYRLVRACRDAGIAVLTVPGPSALTAALAVAGLPPYPATFAGFPPARAKARTDWLRSLAELPHTLVLFLSPHRLATELQACAELLGGGREAALLAELTKLHERCTRAPLGELARLAEGLESRGEFTLVVGPPAVEVSAQTEVTVATARAALADALARGLPLADARRAAAQTLHISRKELYVLLTAK
jgi:16S rRNA (cytidine1402-2'-O)-methyltransferase